MTIPFVLALILLVEAPNASAPQVPQPDDHPRAATPAAPVEFESYQLVLLQRPEHPREYADDKLEEIQQAHLAHLRHLAESGKLLVAGPLDDQPDPRLRGLALFSVGSLDEARQLASQDPAVKAGRLEVVVMTWHTEKDALAFPLAARLRKE